jgi:hypothetical protein
MRGGRYDARRVFGEEYKHLHQEMLNRITGYATLENVAIGGVMAAYGFLFLHKDIPLIAWLAVPFLVVIVAVRCFGIYILLNRNLALHISKIEKEIYQSKFIGYQTYFSATKRNLNIAFNVGVWVSLLGLSLGATYWKWVQPPIIPLF